MMLRPRSATQDEQPRSATQDAAALGASALRLADELIAAVEDGDLPSVERLLANGRVAPSVHDHKALRKAAEKGHVLVVERLLADPRVDPAAHRGSHWHAPLTGRSPLCIAAENGHLAVVRQLLADRRVDPRQPEPGGNDAVSCAAWYGHASVVQCLLEDPRVEPSLTGMQLLSDSISHRFPRIADLLLSTGPMRRAIARLPAARFEALLRQMVAGQCLPSAAQLAACLRNPHAIAAPHRGASRGFATVLLKKLTDVSIICAEAWRRRRAAVLGRIASWDDL